MAGRFQSTFRQVDFRALFDSRRVSFHDGFWLTPVSHIHTQRKEKPGSVHADDVQPPNPGIPSPSYRPAPPLRGVRGPSVLEEHVLSIPLQGGYKRICIGSDPAAGTPTATL